MGTDVSEVTEALQSPRFIKVHRLMCTELTRLVNSVSKILPEIEAARPRCSSGIEALCLLNNAVVKAKLLLQYCSESSKLYLALTGDAILLRCKKSKNLLEQSLSQMQNMVPVVLAAEISQVVSHIRSATFSLDRSEEDAGKVLQHLLHQYGSATYPTEEAAFDAIQVAAVKLHITSQMALLIEKRSIKKLLGEVEENYPRKRRILLFFLSLLSKYGKLIVKEQKENISVQHEEPFPFSSLNGHSVRLESCVLGGPDEAQINMFSISAIPEEFNCPLSLRLMYDPVVITSGQTFERMWIQKWFDEGHTMCPKTKKKLANLSMTPNTGMKDLITKWCAANKVAFSDPSLPAVFQPLETSSSSIASLSSSMDDLSLPIDFCNLSIGSSDARRDTDSSYANIPNDLKMVSTEGDDFHGFQSSAHTQEKDMQILFEFDVLPWESRCKVVKDITNSLNHEHKCRLMSCSCVDLVQTLVNFLKDAHDFHDVEAQKAGCLLLLALVKKCRRSIPSLNEETYGLLASFLETDIAQESLAVLEVLSCHGLGHGKIAASGALTYILRMLEKEIEGLQEPTFKVLCNLSANSSIRALIVPSDFIPKLVSLLEDMALARYSIAILNNFCYNEDARVFVAETDGCIAAIARLLESDSHDDQEHAVAILLSLCSQRSQYGQLIMDEGVIPALVSISINGNDKGKAMAIELLRLLRDEVNDTQECSESDPQLSKDPDNHSTERKSSKAARVFGKISMFSKQSSLTTKTKKIVLRSSFITSVQNSTSRGN